MKWSVVHNGKGPSHLFDDDKGICRCGILAPGCHSRTDDAILDDDAVLINPRYGWPENLDEFCKKCLKFAGVNRELTQLLFNEKFKA